MMDSRPMGRVGKGPPNRAAGESAGGLDGLYAAMASRPNPYPQDWMLDPAALPKKPPRRNG
jgi:hypothetical protein